MFEQHLYTQIKPFSTFSNEIEIIKKVLDNSDLNEILKSIDKIKYNIEKVLFSNKTIVYIKNYGKSSFLLKLNDEYIRMSSIDNFRKEHSVYCNYQDKNEIWPTEYEYDDDDGDDFYERERDFSCLFRNVFVSHPAFA